MLTEIRDIIIIAGISSSLLLLLLSTILIVSIFLKIRKLTKFIEGKFPLRVEIADNIFKDFDERQIQQLSSSRVNDIKNPFIPHESTEDEIGFEQKLCLDSSLMNSTVIATLTSDLFVTLKKSI